MRDAHAEELRQGSALNPRATHGNTLVMRNSALAIRRAGVAVHQRVVPSRRDRSPSTFLLTPVLTTTLDELGRRWNQRLGNKATSRPGSHWWTAADNPDLATDQMLARGQGVRSASGDRAVEIKPTVRAIYWTLHGLDLIHHARPLFGVQPWRLLNPPDATGRPYPVRQSPPPCCRPTLAGRTASWPAPGVPCP